MHTKDQIISNLLGSVCWRAWRGAQSVFYLEFGDKFPDRKGGPLARGTYSVGFSCPWQVLRGEQVVFNSKSEYQVIDDQLALFLNSAITDIRFDPDLHEETLLFSNGLAIRAYHNHPADEWCILTPEEECVVGGRRVGVGGLI